MIREYTTPREYLDDLTSLVERMVARHHRATTGGDEREIAELTLELERVDELIRARCDASQQLGIDLPLDRVRQSLGLSFTEMRVVEVLVALELAARVRQLAAPYLDDAGRVTVELLEALVYRSPRTRMVSGEELGTSARIFRFQLAHVTNADLPWLTRPIRIAPRVIELALGRLQLDDEIARVGRLITTPDRGDALLLDDAKRALVEVALRSQTERPHAPVPFIVGPVGSGRGSIVQAGAHRIDRAVIEIDASALPRDATQLMPLLAGIVRETILFDAVLLVRGIDALAGNDERQIADRITPVIAMLASAPLPLALTATSNCWPRASMRPVVLVELGIPNEEDRQLLWKRALGPDAVELSERAAERYRVTAGVLQCAADFARVQASSRQAPVVLTDVRVGIRVQLDKDLSLLGRRVEWSQTWDDVVLPEDVHQELRELIGRIKYRRRVLDDWGFARKMAKGVGVSALFSGPPGTGKTMVASLVAKELELDLYMIDASRMVSKWIGETEKNLARLFDAAGAGHAVLLFDEADSLFAKRTEVRSSTDRYANLEVNYLLQRMEAFEGVTILTTNLEASIDEAFKRRLAFRIAFPMPEADERARLWRAMLPLQANVSPTIDFDALASKFAMSGGYIRNAVLRAAYLAAAEDCAIEMRHLQRGGMLEYTAMGKVIHSSSL